MNKIRKHAHDHSRLAWLDQLAFELFRATGRSQRMQCLWIYDRDVNLSALRQTYEHLVALAFNRLIEPSRLPWGRPRWVKPAGQHSPLQQGTDVLPRSQFMHWANMQAHAPLDPVTGPAWRMSIQSFDDGSTVVSLVGLHLVLDGMGSVQAIAAAANGVNVPNPYQSRGARRSLTGYVSDLRQILFDAPHTVAALARIARAGWRRPVAPAADPVEPTENKGTAQSDVLADVLELPAAAVTISMPVWDDCAKRLGGRENTLLLGFVAVLAAHMGRRRPSDSAVSLLVPIDTRQGLTDERALAVEFRTMTFAPEGLANNLRPLNAPFTALLRSAAENQTGALTLLLPAIAWLPTRFSAALVNQLFSYADALPVSCSNLGRLPVEMARIDGAPCTRVLTRAVDVNVSRRDLDRSHGHLVAVASRYNDAVSLCIEACQLAPAPTTTDDLRRAIQQTLADFAIDAVIET